MRRPKLVLTIESPDGQHLTRRLQQFAGYVQSRSPVPPLRFKLNGEIQAVSCSETIEREGSAVVFKVKWSFYKELAAISLPGENITFEMFVDEELRERCVFQHREPDDRHSRPLVILLHIPKTAGTSLRAALERKSSIRLLGLYYDPAFMKPSACDSLSEHAFDDLDMIVGHIYHGLHCKTGRPCEYITVLRQPANMMKSYYLFMKYTTGVFKDHLTIEDAIEAPGNNTSFDNVMTRYIAGTSPEARIGEDVFARALRNLENDFAYVGFVETMDVSLGHIGSYLGVELDRIIANVTPPSPEAEIIGLDSLAERFASHLRFDLLIYQRARELFAGGPRSLGG